MYMTCRLGYIVHTFFRRSPKRALVKSLRAWPSTVRTGVKMSSRKELANAIRALSMDACLLYTSPSPRDLEVSRMPSSA